MLWPLIWIAAMLGLVVTTFVVSTREKKARAKLVKKFAPPPMDESSVQGMNDPTQDGFGEADPLDGFGDAGDFASLDQNSFK